MLKAVSSFNSSALILGGWSIEAFYILHLVTLISLRVYLYVTVLTMMPLDLVKSAVLTKTGSVGH
jgi:hypothetical protein